MPYKKNGDCPMCGGFSAVLESRYCDPANTIKPGNSPSSYPFTRRRRECKSCDHRWTTYEIEAEHLETFNETKNHVKRELKKIADIRQKLLELNL